MFIDGAEARLDTATYTYATLLSAQLIRSLIIPSTAGVVCVTGET